MNKKPHSVKISKSVIKNKKMTAIFYNKEGKKIKTIHFGYSPMSDYTIHKDNERKERYLNRHKARENWNDPMTAGALSRWVLWNKKSLIGSIRDFKKKFGLK
jgi:hypothetical protein